MDEIKKGAWSPEEDQKLKAYIKKYGIWNWSQMPKFAGLSRTGKSCRLQWMNYLSPDVKRGPFSIDEVEIVIKTYQELGNRWSAIAARLPGRTDNEVKNFCHTHLKKHMSLKNDRALMKKKARSKRVMKKTKENVETNTGKAQERPAVEVVVPTKIPIIGSSSNKNSLSPNSSSSQYNSIITCQENPTDQDCYNNIISSSRVDQPIIMNMESPFILESNPETSESSLGDTNCNQLIHQFDQYHHDSCNTISDGSSFFDSFDQFDMSSFWFDVLMDAQHLNF